MFNSFVQHSEGCYIHFGTTYNNTLLIPQGGFYAEAKTRKQAIELLSRHIGEKKAEFTLDLILFEILCNHPGINNMYEKSQSNAFDARFSNFK